MSELEIIATTKQGKGERDMASAEVAVLRGRDLLEHCAINYEIKYK